MCYYVEQKLTRKQAKILFNIGIDDETKYLEGDIINGFSYPNIPIITNDKPDIITTSFTWGLLPTWNKDLDSRKNTLNARIETIDDKPSFKNIISNRCLIIATGFYEWRWLDDKGKKKDKYKINNMDSEMFCFGGLYNRGINPLTGEPMNTYTMVTTEANATMAYIHNHKKRMPIILNRKDETAWLDSNNNINDFAFPYQSNLIGFQST